MTVKAIHKHGHFGQRPPSRKHFGVDEMGNVKTAKKKTTIQVMHFKKEEPMKTRIASKERKAEARSFVKKFEVDKGGVLA